MRRGEGARDERECGRVMEVVAAHGDGTYAIDYDDSGWPGAKEFTEEEVGPKEPFFQHDFSGAKFIWSDDVKLDNLVLFRTVVKSPPDGIERPDFRGLTDVVPERGGGGGGRRGGGGNRGQRGPNRSN